MNVRRSLALAVLVSVQTIAIAGAPPTTARTIGIRALSTRADRVTGGNVLVEIVAPGAGAPVVALNGRDVSSIFRAAPGSSGVVGLVANLALGRNVLTVAGKTWGVKDESLQLTNYPLTGPVISGPSQQPFICQTDTFKLPDGSMLGAATDANCSAATRIQYVYLPKGAKDFVPLSNTSAIPADAETTTTIAGKKVPFVVRVETGTMNRGIYQNVILHDPTRDAPPTPFSPPPAWNRRLIAIHGVGCPSGWYRQGGVMGVNPLAGPSLKRLGEGYAIFINTLNHPTNSCNAFLAGETTMMGKEHFIETFGVPDFTVSMGTSGGAYTSLQIADEFPGLFDGVIVNATFPDALSIALSGSDAHLLTHYFASQGSEPGGASGLTDAQKVAVSGFSSMKAFLDAANQSQRTDPVAGRPDVDGYKPAVWNEAMPENLRYDAKTNPHGARPTVYDAAKNIYGVDAKTGFALRAFDNVGVQYGLAALRAGVITPAQFLSLNESIGGLDSDSNYTAARTVGGADAIRRAYQAGLTLSGGGGLASIPVFDDGAYNDAGGYHYQWFHFAIRERMIKANGNADNHVMWRGPVQAEEAWPVFVSWVAHAKADPAPGSQREKTIRNKPAEAMDGCWATMVGKPTFVPEPQTFGHKPDSRCNTAFPSAAFTRYVAGGPIDANTLKCQLKPVGGDDYASFTADDMQRLHAIFPAGVCDFSKPGVSQTRVLPWASFGPAPENLIFEVSLHKASD